MMIRSASILSALFSLFAIVLTATATAQPASATEPSPVDSVSITIRSSCSRTVKVAYGDTTASISGNETDSRSLRVGDKVKVLDDSEHALDSITIEASTREVQIGSDCASVSAR